MKYVLYYDLFSVLKSKYRYILGYFILTFLIFFYKKALNIENNDLLLGVLGLNPNNNLIFMMLYYFNRFFFLFITFQIFTYDFQNSLDNLFLRVKSDKWILFKIISNILYTFTIKFILYFLLVFIQCLLFSESLSLSILSNIFVIDFFYTIFLQFLFLLYYFIFQCYAIFGKILLFFNLFFVKYIFVEWNTISNYIYLYIFILMFILIILILLYKNKHVTIFERNCDKK